MTHKERKEMLTNWVKNLNKNAYLERADTRCGCRFAVATKTKMGTKFWTKFYDLKTLENVLVELFDYDNFKKLWEES